MTASAKSIFISDFDGTMTHIDFYHIIINKYLKNFGTELFQAWKRKEMTDVVFLNKIFTSITKPEDAVIKDDILNIPFDMTVIPFIKALKKINCDFLILSAGSDYYIRKLIFHHGLKDVMLIANHGIFENGGIKMIPDEKSPFYSEIYGIDKEKAVKFYMKKYGTVFYAGDSEPDLKASLNASTIFAKRELQNLLTNLNREFIPFSDFSEIHRYLTDKKVLPDD